MPAFIDLMQDYNSGYRRITLRAYFDRAERQATRPQANCNMAM